MIALDVTLKGLPDFERRLKRLPVVADRAAQLAINYAIRRARTLASKAIRGQVNLTASYLNSPGRLFVSKFARAGDSEARLSARARPTQLAQFKPIQKLRRGKSVSRRRAGISVRVKAGGKRRTLRQAFFVRLKRGSAEGGNVGIAVRDTTGLNLKKGGKASGFQVLYAPSVDQVFKTVRNDIAPEVNALAAREFDRQIARLIK